MDKPIDWTPVCLSLEEVAVRAGNEVLVEVDDNCTLIVGNAQGILGWLLRVWSIHSSNMIIIIITKLEEGRERLGQVF